MLRVKALLKECGNMKFYNRSSCKRFMSHSFRNHKPHNQNEDSIIHDKIANIKQMNSSILCIFSNMLVKENIKNAFLWKKIEQRSYELIDKFEISDIASLLFCLSKIRYDTTLYESFIPAIRKKYEYLNTSHLAMLISAYSKRKKEDLILLLKEEFKKKAYTVHNIIEISMILNALVKCKIKDEELFYKLSHIIVDLISYNSPMHARDLCAILYCYSYIQLDNYQIFKIVSHKILYLMDDVTLVDLCRILFAYMNIRKNFNHIIKIATVQLKTIADKSSISDIINCIHFLPIIKQTIEKEDSLNRMGTMDEDNTGTQYSINYCLLFDYILHIFNETIIKHANIIDASHISNIFYIYSRYNLYIEFSKLSVLLNRMIRLHMPCELKIYILYSLTLMLKNTENGVFYNSSFLNFQKIFVKKKEEAVLRNYKMDYHESTNEEIIQSRISKNDRELAYMHFKDKLLFCVKEWEKDVILFLNSCHICTILDIIKICSVLFILNYKSQTIMNSIKHFIILNYKDIHEQHASTILFYFQRLQDINDEDDFAQVLKWKMRVK